MTQGSSYISLSVIRLWPLVQEMLSFQLCECVSVSVPIRREREEESAYFDYSFTQDQIVQNQDPSTLPAALNLHSPFIM